MALTQFRDRIAGLILLALMLASAVFPAFAQGEEEDDSQKAVAIFRQAQDAHEKGDLAAAIDLYKKVLELVPALPEAEYQIGSAYLSLRKADEAEANFRKAVEHRPDWSLAVAALGDVLTKKERRLAAAGDAKAAAEASTEASALLKKAIELDAANALAWTALADLRLSSNAEPAELRSTLDSIRKLTEGKMNAPTSLWSARGSLESKLNDPAAARSFRNVIALEPRNKAALTALAELDIRRGDPATARTWLERLRAAYPKDADVTLLSARILAAEDKVVDAIREIDSIPAPGPDALAFRRTLTATSTENAAELEYRLKSDEKNAVILGRLCTLYRADTPEKALEFCRRASEADPGNINHAIGFGAALVQAKRYEQAVGLLKKIVEIAPDNTTARANLAASYFQLKAYAQARDEYQWLIDHRAGVPIAYYLIGIAHDQLGAYLDALANYQLFLKNADPTANHLEIEKVNLRLPALAKLVRKK